MSKPMIKGSCLCGAIHYEIDHAPAEAGHCHCSMCQKAHGAAFATYASVRNDGFRFTDGQNRIAQYRSSANVVRTFCKICGSNLQFIKDGKDEFGLAVGTIDAGTAPRPTFQIWTASRADWGEIDDDLPSYETEPR